MNQSIADRLIKFNARNDNRVTVNAAQGHFATSHSHVNYYIDVTRIKVRISEAREAARFLRDKMVGNVQAVDSIVCLDGTEVLGALLAEEIEKGGFEMNNAHETTYVVTPEENSINQFMFRENNRLAIEGKNVLLLVDTMTTGGTVKRALNCITYYGGNVSGIAAIFSTMGSVASTRVYSVFDQEDFPGYQSYSPQDCPMCKKKIPLDAIVNGYGYAKL